MIEQSIEKVLRRERMIAGTAVAVLLALSFTYLIWLYLREPPIPQSMSDMGMTGMLRPWTLSEFAIAFGMWSAMMVGMMAPSVAPAILTYARFSRHPITQKAPLAPIGWFVGGYLAAWIGFAFIATLVQAEFLEAGLITPMLRSSSGLFGGTVFIVAGVYQFTALKDTCLSFCRSPVNFINKQGGYRPSVAATLKLGLKHGLYCVGCCWALMLVLFVVGVMELLWIAVISVWVLVEKIFPT